MPLVTCPDCGKEVSDQAPTCPHCGRSIAMRSGPLGGFEKGITTRPDFWHDRNVGCIAAGILVLGFLLWLAKGCYH
jgi:zinc-ribbon domain